MIDKQATKTLLRINTFQLRKTQQKQIVFKIAFVNQKQQWKSKILKDKFQEKWQQTNFSKRRSKWSQKMIPLSKHKCHENKKDTKIENNLYTLPKQSNQDTLTEILCVKNQWRLQPTKKQD